MTVDVNVHIYVHDQATASVSAQLAAILTKLSSMETHIMAELDDLTTQVQATTDAEQSAIVLLNGLAAALAAAGTDPTKLAALRAALKSNTDALAAAVVANQLPTSAPPA